MAIGISEFAGIIGSFFTISAIPNWYAGLAKPALNPPSWVFGPVWTALYAVMGISLFLVWKQHSNILKNVGMLRIWKIGTAAFYVQLSLNAVWSIIFFGLRSPGGAFVEIIFLWLAILATIVAFYKISKLAAWLLVPYILWVSFAAYLNYSIMRLNPISPVPISTYAPSSHSART
ncbi:MAG: tryptophan-rich sensory protein [Candidatus Colwellbacteria bacterium]|nr:tryptophan-rich sensory protein [Candidatus Colwellbacteria bacterium]